MKYNQEELEAKLQELVKDIDKAEQKAVEFALEYNLCLELGDYGAGKRLLLNDDEARQYGLTRGDWLYSSETC